MGVTRNLAKFLGKTLSEDQLNVIAYECAFDQMKQNETVNKAKVGARGYFDFKKSPFIRAGKVFSQFKSTSFSLPVYYFLTGKVGNWKHQFSPEQNKQVDDWIHRNLQRPELQGLKFRYE